MNERVGGQFCNKHRVSNIIRSFTVGKVWGLRRSAIEIYYRQAS